MVENEITMEGGKHTLYLIYKRNIFFSFSFSFSFFFFLYLKKKRKIGGMRGAWEGTGYMYYGR